MLWAHRSDAENLAFKRPWKAGVCATGSDQKGTGRRRPRGQGALTQVVVSAQYSVVTNATLTPVTATPSAAYIASTTDTLLLPISFVLLLMLLLAVMLMLEMRPDVSCWLKQLWLVFVFCWLLWRAYWGFEEHFKQMAVALYNTLDSSQQKLLQGVSSSSSSTNSLNNPTNTRQSSSSAKDKARTRSASNERALMSAYRSVGIPFKQTSSLF